MGLGRSLRGSIAAVSAVAFACAGAPSAASASYSYPQQLFSVSEGTQAGADAYCQPDEVAIGGGVSAHGDYSDSLFVSSTRPRPDNDIAWNAYIDNFTGGVASNTVVVYAVCDGGAVVADYSRRMHLAAITLPDGKQRSAKQKCGAHETVVGGGGFSSGTYSKLTEFSASAPYDGNDPDKLPDDGWKVTANNEPDAGGEPVTIDVWAICDKRHGPSAYHFVQKSGEVKDGEQGYKGAYCPVRQPLVGGGVAIKGSLASGVFIQSTFPNAIGTQRLWAGLAINYATPDAKKHKINVTAICKR